MAHALGVRLRLIAPLFQMVLRGIGFELTSAHSRAALTTHTDTPDIIRPIVIGAISLHRVLGAVNYGLDASPLR